MLCQSGFSEAETQSNGRMPQSVERKYGRMQGDAKPERIALEDCVLQKE